MALYSKRVFAHIFFWSRVIYSSVYSKRVNGKVSKNSKPQEPSGMAPLKKYLLELGGVRLSFRIFILPRLLYAATRPPGGLLRPALGPHNQPFESARTARCLRACLCNRVGALGLHALRRAERRGAREKGCDQHRRTIRDWHHQRVQSRQRGLRFRMDTRISQG